MPRGGGGRRRRVREVGEEGEGGNEDDEGQPMPRGGGGEKKGGRGKMMELAETGRAGRLEVRGKGEKMVEGERFSFQIMRRKRGNLGKGGGKMAKNGAWGEPVRPELEEESEERERRGVTVGERTNAERRPRRKRKGKEAGVEG